MKIKLFSFLILLVLFFACNNDSFDEPELTPDLKEKLLIKCDSIYEQLSQRNADTLGTISKIPTTLNECFNALDTIFTDELKEWVICLPQEEFGVRMHFGVGLYMRNNWNLWKGGELASYLESKSFEHPDNMSGIILYLYHRKLRGKNYDIDKLVNYIEKEEEKLKMRRKELKKSNE